MKDNLINWLIKIGLGSSSEWIAIVIILLGIILISIIADFITKKIILLIVRRIVKKSKNVWDDILLDKKVFHRFSQIVPIFFIYYSINIAFPTANGVVLIIQKLTMVYLVIVFSMIVNSFLNAVNEIYNITIGNKKGTSIKSYIQIVKIILLVLVILIILSILLNKDIWYFITGLGAMTAILMLIFKDTILGLVAGIQLAANEMVKIGDWISIPSRNTDGVVLEVSLHTVKVQNWDNTISTIPTYSLVSETFHNWRGMDESGGRRIKRSIYIDMKSIKFCSPELLEKLSKFYFLKDYIPQKLKEIEEYNKSFNVDSSVVVNGRRLTNIGVFRKYLEEYLRNNNNINQEMTLIVRHLDPTPKGLPIEIYAFSKKKNWVEYEGVQADIFDYILSLIDEFELKVFQDPSGEDLKFLKN